MAESLTKSYLGVIKSTSFGKSSQKAENMAKYREAGFKKKGLLCKTRVQNMTSGIGRSLRFSFSYLKNKRNHSVDMLNKMNESETF